MKIKRILALLLVLMLPVTIFAEESQPQGTEYQTEQIEQVTGQPEVQTPVTNDAIDGIIDESVTIDVVEGKIMNKLNDVVGLLQKIAAPLSIITFIIGAIIMVTGALGKRDGAKQGMVVCVLSIIMYSICMYSEPIIKAIAAWIAS